jgi:hypothetical protein
MIPALIDNRQRPVLTDLLGRQPKHIVFALDINYPQPFTVSCDGLLSLLENTVTSSQRKTEERDVLARH